MQCLYSWLYAQSVAVMVMQVLCNTMYLAVNIPITNRKLCFYTAFIACLK